MHANRLPATLMPLVVLAAAPMLAAERSEPMPNELKDVGVTEHRSAQIPLDLKFTESTGRQVTLGDFFDGKRPVLLTMNYSNCPMLCTLQLTGLFQGMQAMEWGIGNNFQVVTVIIDPKETPERAALTKKKYLKVYGRPGAADGWHILTGREADIRKLAATVGFGYTYDPDAKQYAHPAVTMVCTPQGVVSRYLYGIEYDPQTLKLSLVEAGQGKIGSPLDQIILYCFHYDAEKGRYGPAAEKIMRIGGAVMVLALAGMVVFFWRRGERRNRGVKPHATEAAETP